jgi:hypothetical protein
MTIRCACVTTLHYVALLKSQFHALVDQLQQKGVTGITAKSLRREAVTWLHDNAGREIDDGSIGEKTTLRTWLGIMMVDINWEQYLAKMRKKGEWATRPHSSRSLFCTMWRLL